MKDKRDNIINKLNELEALYRLGLQKVCELRRDLEGVTPPAPSGENAMIVNMVARRQAKILAKAGK